MKSTKPIIRKNGVIGIIRNERDEILISKRFDPNVPQAHLKWDVPGGKIEKGETPHQALLREILEETGLYVKILNKLGETTHPIWETKNGQLRIRLDCYLCQFQTGQLNLTDPKIDALKWIKKTEIEKFDFLPTTKSYLNLLFD